MELLTNLRAAFGVMATEQGHDSSSAEAIWRKLGVPTLYTCFPAIDVMRAEIALRELRQPNDESDPHSPLWKLCCGDAEDWPEVVKPLNTILNELFHILG